jgi:hypothetical protein
VPAAAKQASVLCGMAQGTKANAFLRSFSWAPQAQQGSLNEPKKASEVVPQ